MELARAILFVKNIDCMTAFYRDALGLRVVPETATTGWVELEAGGASLALHAIPEEIARTITITDPPKRRGEAPVKLVFRTPDLEAARTVLIARGGMVSERWSWNAYDVVDPEGNVFQIVAISRSMPS
jgi:catechol-2,3-dioxygenase